MTEVVSAIIYLFLFTLLCAASVFDFRYRRIPNEFVVWSLVNGCFLNMLCGRAGLGILTALAAFAAAFPLYLIGAAGAGDVKVFLAAGLLLKLQPVMKLGMYTLILTALYGMIYRIVCRKSGLTKVLMAPEILAGAVILLITGGIE
jgi:prepilin peptidase CpaA